MPTGENNNLLTIVVETGSYYRGVPFPRLLSNEFGVGLVEVFVHIVKDCHVHGLTRQRTIPTNGPNKSRMAHRLRNLRVALIDVIHADFAVVEERVGKNRLIRLGVDYALNISIEGLGLVGGVRAYNNLPVRVKTEDEGRKHTGTALGVVGWHKFVPSKVHTTLHLYAVDESVASLADVGYEQPCLVGSVCGCLVI